jgi:N-acetylglucosamine kinase-like BadF-type ATPase
MPYYLGVDVGGTKTHTVIADETGRVVGFGESGPGNHQTIGYDGLYASIYSGLGQALGNTGISVDQIAGAGFGIAGYDWPSEIPMMNKTIDRLGLSAPYRIVNDSIPGIVAGARDGWGVGVVSGTGCNCRGWDKEHKREGRVTGYGIMMGEGAGSTEIVYRAMQIVSFAWTKRVQPTTLTQAFIEYVEAKDELDLIEGYVEGRYNIGAACAPLIFRVAESGDAVARDVVRWAGYELGELVNAVIHQLEFEPLSFDVVLAGSMFEGGLLLTEPMRETIQKVAPGARLVRLNVRPVAGAVLIGMEMGGLTITPAIRDELNKSINQVSRKQRAV